MRMRGIGVEKDDDGLYHVAMRPREDADKAPMEGLSSMVKSSRKTIKDLASSEYFQSLMKINVAESFCLRDDLQSGKALANTNQTGLGVFSPRGAPYVPLGTPDLRRPQLGLPGKGCYGKLTGKGFDSGLFHQAKRRRDDPDSQPQAFHVGSAKNGSITRDPSPMNEHEPRIEPKARGGSSALFPRKLLFQAERRRMEVSTGSRTYKEFLEDGREDHFTLVELLGAVKATEEMVKRQEEFMMHQNRWDENMDDSASIAASVILGTDIVVTASRDDFESKRPATTLAERHLAEDRNDFVKRLEEKIQQQHASGVTIKPPETIQGKSFVRKRRRMKAAIATAIAKPCAGKNANKKSAAQFLEKLLRWRNEFNSLKADMGNKLENQLAQRRIERVRVLQDPDLFGVFCTNTAKPRLQHKITRPAISRELYEPTKDIWVKNTVPTHHDVTGADDSVPDLFIRRATMKPRPDRRETDRNNSLSKPAKNDLKKRLLVFVSQKFSTREIDITTQRFIVALTIELASLQAISTRRLERILDNNISSTIDHADIQTIVAFLRSLAGKQTIKLRAS